MPFQIDNYIIDPLSLFLLFSSLGGFLIALYISRFRETAGSNYLALLQTAISTWTIFYFLEYSATDLQSKIFWSKFSYLGIPLIPVWFYLFSRSFESRQKKISNRIQLPLIIGAFFFVILVFTNQFHQLHWKSISINPAHNTTIYRYGPTFWLLFIFTYTFLTLGILNILSLFRRYANQIHSAMWLMLVACFIPIFGNFIYVFKINPIPGFDWTPTLFFTTGVILAYINIRFGSIDLIPFARKKLIDVMNDGFLLCDMNYRIADINESTLNLINRSRADVIGKHIADAVPERIDLIKKIQPGPDPFSMEFTTRLKPDKRTVFMQSTPLFDKNKMLCGHLMIFRDITALKKNEETIIETNTKLKQEIEENQKLIEDLDNFAHTVAHDLRNTIGSIIGLSDLATSDMQEKDFSGIAHYNSIINSSAKKTLYIMEELLTMSTIRQQEVNKELVDMNNVVDEALERLREMASSRNAKIDRTKTLPSVAGIPSWLEEVWVNFISNAIKYGGHPPVIKLGAEQLYAEQKIKYWIKDNGNGLSIEDQQKLFTQFTRLEVSRAHGTGLGLSIVKRIIEKLGGEIGVFSSSIPGEGCLFYFILPMK